MKRKEKKQDWAEEEAGMGFFVTTEASASPTGSSEAEVSCRAVPVWGEQGGQALHPPTDQLSDVGCPGKRA